MAKLFPPYIEGTLPAFYKGTSLKVPYSMNRGVSFSQISGFSMKIKSIQSSTYLFSKRTEEKCWDKHYAYFNIAEEIDNFLKPGLYYKLQLAYIDNTNTVGQYSTVGIIKYTTKPEVFIQGLSDDNSVNINWSDFIGVYRQDPEEGDLTERIYSYKFDFYDSDDNLIDTSGILLHNSSTDSVNYEFFDTYYFKKALTENKKYYVQYSVTSQNGLILSSPKYAIIEKYSLETLLNIDLYCTLNFDNGYIDVWLQEQQNNQSLITGNFILFRSEKDLENNTYNTWDMLFKFSLVGDEPTQRLWRDYTVEQGKTYKYAIQQYNKNNVYSARKESEEITADFEDMFLSDGIKQLKIRFNPRVSSFKNDILESKIDTIGSKYPFIFRNGRVYYKEFPISGLISRLMDEEELFIDWDKSSTNKARQKTAFINQSIYGTSSSASNSLSSNEDLKTDLIFNNIFQERDFKLKVLEWLNNGEPKIFRSPTEGNYIVRLLNVSLTPNDTLGRMLHNFQCTAYEVDEFNYENLNNLNFLQFNYKEKTRMLWKTKKFYHTITNNNGEEEIEYLSNVNILQNSSPIISFQIEDCKNGDTFKIKLEDSSEYINIVIGATGQYVMNYPIPITEFIIPEGTQSMGQITYSYYFEPTDDFDRVEEIKVIDVPCYQYINDSEDEIIDLIEEILTVKNSNNETIENPKININKIYYIKIYADPFLTNHFLTDEPMPSGAILNYSKEEYSYLKNDTDFMDNNFIKVHNERPYFIPIYNLDAKDLTHLLVFPNTIVEIGYQQGERVFEGETRLTSYGTYLNNYTAFNDWITSRTNCIETDQTDYYYGENDYDTLYNPIKPSYNKFIEDLYDMLNPKVEEEG